MHFPTRSAHRKSAPQPNILCMHMLIMAINTIHVAVECAVVCRGKMPQPVFDPRTKVHSAATRILWIIYMNSIGIHIVRGCGAPLCAKHTGKRIVWMGTKGLSPVHPKPWVETTKYDWPFFIFYIVIVISRKQAIPKTVMQSQLDFSMKLDFWCENRSSNVSRPSLKEPQPRYSWKMMSIQTRIHPLLPAM